MYIGFSKHQELKTQTSLQNKVLLITFQSESPLHMFSVDTVWQVFAQFGFVEKVVMVQDKHRIGLFYFPLS